MTMDQAIFLFSTPTSLNSFHKPIRLLKQLLPVITQV